MKVRFNSCSKEQRQWGNCADPKDLLVPGEVYELERAEVHSWHTKYFLKGIPYGYNSVCFTEVED